MIDLSDIPPGDRKTILVVDDEEHIRRMIARILSKYGFTPLTASDAIEGLMMIQDRDVDMVITDIRMPGMNGLDFIGQIHELNHDIPVIVITGYGNFETAVDSVKRGAFFFVTKPFETATFVEVVRKGLRLPRLEVRSGVRFPHVHYTLEFDVPPDVGMVEGVAWHVSRAATSFGYDEALATSHIPFVLDELLVIAIEACRAAGSGENILVTATLGPDEVTATIRVPVECYDRQLLPRSMEDSDIGTRTGVGLMMVQYYCHELLFSDDRRSATFTVRREGAQARAGNTTGVNG